jgi:hypothetical protein
LRQDWRENGAVSHGAQPFADERRPFASRTIRAAIVVGVLAWSALRGFGTVSASDFDQLAERPGAEVTRSTSIDGSEHTTIRLPGGVSITRITRDGKSRYLEMDESGRGAVMCIWEIYVALLAQMRVCSVADDGFEEELTRALDRMNDFIVANSLSPVTKNDAEDRWTRRSTDTLPDFRSLRPISDSRLVDRIIPPFFSTSSDPSLARISGAASPTCCRCRARPFSIPASKDRSGT